MDLKNLHRKTELDSHEEDQEWLLTYSDMITLLLAFFAVLIAVSYVDLNLWEQMKQGLRSEINKQENVQTPLAEVKKDLDEKLAEEREAELVDITLDREGIKLFFNSSSFYNSGEANLLPTGQQIIDKVTQAMNDLGYYKFKVDVEGHSDNVPINTPVYPSNWELSVARASGVVKYFIQEGIEPERIKASGYADTKPIVPHVDEAGNDIVENRALNRRIVIRIYY
ncbi:MAG: OmpA family protein [Balneola sp.]|nr:OmpA family protein [Balneola sp.]MBO6650479.1 OmpA family protein [Balneola sp.]MBO6711476.1 OmpA family protein [Balneola sp.]MBO6799672.1 OmpA family protein [Balneola sp.]MBO6870887.1 OmpA family protein [Balneola sp.]